VSTIPERIVFLKKIHLFSGLSDDDLSNLAQMLVDEPFKTGDTIIKQDTHGDTFYIIYRGFVKVVRQKNKREQVLAHLVAQDFFGEEELFSKKKRSASIIADSDGSVLALHHSKLNELIKRSPKLKPNFDVVISTHRLWRQLQFKWVRADEVVYFVARKHPILLWQALTGPGLAFLASAIMFLWGMVVGSLFAIWIGIAAMLATSLWVVWQIIDWSNDYYVVTNQRVVWIEKIVGIYDSRQEAPLTTILSVGVETDPLGRILDFGNVVVRTFVGRIDFSHVSHPNHASHMIEEHWNRTKSTSSGEEKEAMKTALRQRLGLIVQAPVEKEKPKTADKSALPKPYHPTLFTILTSNILKFRIEDAGTITYRKHGFVLFRQIWQPAFFLLLIFALWINRFLTLAQDPAASVIHQGPNGWSIDIFIFTLPLIALPILGWFTYQYVDWANDLFQITSDQIVDLDRTPFGRTERRAAPLDNILSTEYQRMGLLGHIFNYGTVYITVGGSKLEFQDVYDPAAVQQDIDGRRAARVAGKRAIEKKAERERMAEWLVTYHDNADEFTRQQDAARKNPEQNRED
jgi:uncharacterized membrane protein YdbT with pleckstrin-like domain